MDKVHGASFGYLWSTISFQINLKYKLVQDDTKLLDDGGEIPNSQGRGWWFDSQL